MAQKFGEQNLHEKCLLTASIRGADWFSNTKHSYYGISDGAAIYPLLQLNCAENLYGTEERTNM